MTAYPCLETARAWISRWDHAQEYYAPGRTARWEALLDALAALKPQPARIIDLGCGPGSLSARLAQRFVHTEVVGIDADPLLTGLARAAWPDLNWVTGRFAEVDLGRCDAVVSSTTLHYLSPEELAGLFADLATHCDLILNADLLPLPGQELPPAPLWPWQDWWSQARQAPEIWQLRGSAQDLPSGDYHLGVAEFAGIATQAGWTCQEVWRQGASAVLQLTR